MGLSVEVILVVNSCRKIQPIVGSTIQRQGSVGSTIPKTKGSRTVLGGS